ncbi:MAG: dienelactone hydrolase family protein [Chloroflexi bacterium]|nr:dienelactone hydrolase family protein [Chloroflexota bacterium]
MALEGLTAETIKIRGYNNDEIDAYVARPLGAGPFPGVFVIHHMPGWDEWSREVVNKFALYGYLAISPNLHHRMGPGSLDDVMAAVRASGGMDDAQFVGDLDGGVDYLRSLPNLNGKVGCIGFCSGGRQAYIAAAKAKNIDAAVDCWGGNVIMAPESLNEKQPVAPIDMTSEIKVPLLGIFGNEDQAPPPEQVDATEEALKAAGKSYEFYRYDGAGHGFFAAHRPSYRVEQTMDGWEKVFAFLGKHLS